MAQQFYKLTSNNGVVSEFTDKTIADQELQNLINNGKGGTISIVWHYTPEELRAMADEAHAWTIKTRSADNKSKYAHMVLELMDTDTHAENYCSALREVLSAFPEINREEIEKELDRYI